MIVEKIEVIASAVLASFVMTPCVGGIALGSLLRQMIWSLVVLLSLPVTPGATGSPALGATKNVLGLPPSEGVVDVQASFQLLAITSIDEEAETFEFTGILSLQWMDDRQAFDPAEAGVEEKIFQGDYQFNELSPAWFPQIGLVNASGMFETSGVVLRVQPDGRNRLVQMVSAIAKVQLELRRTPFDTQRLDAAFVMFGFNADEVTLTMPLNSDSTQPSAIEVPQWTIERVALSTREIDASFGHRSGRSSALVMSVNVRRQSLFILRLVVMPLTLIVILSWSVFWMDRSSLGDRINVSFVGILTAAAYQIIVGDIMPRVSQVTLLSGFVDVSFWVMCASVVINLVVGEADKDGDMTKGDRIDRYCRIVFPSVYFGLLLVGTAFLLST